MFKIDLQSAKIIESSNRAVIRIDSPEYDISFLENDPLDNVEYYTLFISSTSNVFPHELHDKGSNIPMYLGASADVIAFGHRGDSVLGEVLKQNEQENLNSNILRGSDAPVTKLYKDVANEEFSITTEYIKRVNNASTINKDAARLSGTTIEYSHTQYGYVNKFNTKVDTIVSKYIGITASVINNSIESPVHDSNIKKSALTLKNLFVKVNPHQFLEIKLEFMAQISSIEQLPPGLVLDNKQRIIGVLQYAGEYDILIKLVSGDELDAKIICLPIKRIA